MFCGYVVNYCVVRVGLPCGVPLFAVFVIGLCDWLLIFDAVCVYFDLVVEGVFCCVLVFGFLFWGCLEFGFGGWVCHECGRCGMMGFLGLLRVYATLMILGLWMILGTLVFWDVLVSWVFPGILGSGWFQCFWEFLGYCYFGFLCSLGLRLGFMCFRAFVGMLFRTFAFVFLGRVDIIYVWCAAGRLLTLG